MKVKPTQINLSSLSEELQERIRVELAAESAEHVKSGINIARIKDLLLIVLKEKVGLSKVTLNVSVKESDKGYPYLEVESNDLLVNVDIEKLFKTLKIVSDAGFIRDSKDVTIPLKWRWKTFDGRESESVLGEVHCDLEGNLLRLNFN